MTIDPFNHASSQLGNAVDTVAGVNANIVAVLSKNSADGHAAE
jgi:hypothetical protein